MVLDPDRPDKVVKVGAASFSDLGESLPNLLREFKDVFAFEAEEMPGIDPELAVHKLAVDPNKKSVRQKKRNHGEERNKAATTEVKQLLDASFIR